MKAIILFLFLIIPISVFAFQNPFGKAEKCAEKEDICHHSIKVSDNTTMIFEGGCDVLKYVGIIYINNKRIIKLDDNFDIISDQKLKNMEIFEKTVIETFHNPKRVEYKMYNESDIDN